MKETRAKNISLISWVIRTLVIMASTIAAVDLLKQDYSFAMVIGVAWSLLIIAERRILRSEGKD